ncbi:cytochrome P450 [Antrihabitans stalactiti]|uniref:Cytochrome P450 n=1 Tax=Antrihabitans stalactiti TaxID=2584121 RepID=A0A848KGH4_9NOCA|nr:cytochrome P450 [Antrihabitans stalactiti]
MANSFPEASTLDGIRFTAQVAVPNVVQGLFRRRRRVTGAAKLVDADKQAVRFYEGLVRDRDEPFYIRVGKDKSLLVHQPEDIKAVLEGSPDPFASDPDAKKKGMSHFQPDALTISRGALWENRRKFAEAILDTGKPLHHLAQTFLAVANEEADALGAEDITWERINDAFLRITRRVIFGEPAADDTEVSQLLADLMDEANSSPSGESKHFKPFMDKVQHYVDVGAQGSLCSLVAGAPQNEETKPAGQLVHWLFAMGDTLPANVFRTLAVLATHRPQLAVVRKELTGADLESAEGVAQLDYLAACLQDTMRLWPTTPMFARVTARKATLRDSIVPAGTQVFIYNLGNHRNRDRVSFADRFAPEEWVSGNAAENWLFNFFSNGAQGCPGAGLAVFLGTAVLARLLEAADPRMSGADLHADRALPHTLDIFSLTVGFDKPPLV